MTGYKFVHISLNIFTGANTQCIFYFQFLFILTFILFCLLYSLEYLVSLRVEILLCLVNAGRFLFNNSAGTPIMTLVSTSGNLLIGTTTDNGNKLQVNGNASVTKLYATAGADMGSSKITSVANGTSTNDAVNYGQLTSLLPTRTDGYLLGSFDGGVPIYVGHMSVANAKIIFTPSTGGTVNLTNNYLNIIAPYSTIATLTLNLPSSPNEGDRVVLKFTSAITSITYTGGSVNGNPTTAAKGNEWSLTYDSFSGDWY